MICVSKNKSYLKSQNLKIIGRNILRGEVKISGAKNSALVLLAASLLTDEKIILDKVYKRVIESLEKLNTKKEETIINELNSFDKDKI